MPLRPGERLGPYQIVAVLGAGGMGEVYRARDARLGREVAIKVLGGHLAGDANALTRLDQEARTLAALNHPNLLSVYDVGTGPGGHPYIVSELLEGVSLRQRLGEGALPQGKAADAAAQLARGLAAAHEKGIVHRDLKPDNIFVMPDGRVKILDFGLAKLAGVAAGDAATQLGAATAPGTVLGTVGYMAPEQVRGQPSDHRSDIFSLGCVLYEMLTGNRAFQGASAVEVMSAILQQEPVPVPPTVAPALDRIARHCLEKEPQQRFHSAHDIAYSLGDVSQPSTSAVPALAEPAGGRRWKWASVAAGVAAAGLLLWLASGRGAGTVSTPVFQQLSFQRGLVTGARFLPDGQSFVLSMRNGSQPDALFTGRLANDGLQTLAVAGEEVVAVSKTGEALLLSSGRDYNYAAVGALSRLPLNGDAPRPVLDDISAADWSPDGTAMAIVRREAATNQETLEYPPGHALFTQTGWINWVRVAPDGQHVAFLAHAVFGDDRGRVGVVDTSGHVQMLTPLYSSANGLAWGPGNREIWYTAAPSGILRAVYAVNLAGRIRRLLSGASTLTLEDVARDGRALMASGDYRMSATVVTPQQPAGRDVSIENGTLVNAISDDGRQLLLTEMSTVGYAAYVRKSDGAPPVPLGEGEAAAFSPDGRWALLQNPDTGQLLLQPTGAGEARALPASEIRWQSFNGASLGNAVDSFLPDSQSFVALGAVPGQPAGSYRITLDGQATAVTPAGVIGTLPTPDGQALLARRTDGTWWLVPFNRSAPVPMPALQPGDEPARFGASNDELLLGQLDAANSSLQFIRLHLRSGQRDKLMLVRPSDPGFIAIRGYAIAKDGASYAYTATTAPASLYLVSGLH